MSLRGIERGDRERGREGYGIFEHKYGRGIQGRMIVLVFTPVRISSCSPFAVYFSMFIVQVIVKPP